MRELATPERSASQYEVLPRWSGRCADWLTLALVPYDLTHHREAYRYATAGRQVLPFARLLWRRLVPRTHPGTRAARCWPGRVPAHRAPGRALRAATCRHRCRLCGRDRGRIRYARRYASWTGPRDRSDRAER